MRLDADILQLAVQLDRADVEALRVCFRGRQYRAGQTVFREGEPGGFLLLVSEGEFTVTTRSAGNASSVIGRVAAGELCGEMALIDPAPRSATVTARVDTIAWELGHDALEVLRRNAPGAARAVVQASLRTVAARLRRLGERVDREALT
ncbi:MAG: cyclic nucleotide-binding domain-containing protein [Byssovorax sp.]